MNYQKLRLRKFGKKLTTGKANWVAHNEAAKCWNKSYHIQVHPNLKQTLLLFIRVSSGCCLDSRKHCGMAVWLITSIYNLVVADYNGIIFKVTPMLYDKWMNFSKRVWSTDNAGHGEIFVRFLLLLLNFQITFVFLNSFIFYYVFCVLFDISHLYDITTISAAADDYSQ